MQQSVSRWMQKNDYEFITEMPVCWGCWKCWYVRSWVKVHTFDLPALSQSRVESRIIFKYPHRTNRCFDVCKNCWYYKNLIMLWLEGNCFLVGSILAASIRSNLGCFCHVDLDFMINIATYIDHASISSWCSPDFHASNWFNCTELAAFHLLVQVQH